MHDLAKEARDEASMDMEVTCHGHVSCTENGAQAAADEDYDYSLQLDYGSVSNYSTLRTGTRSPSDL